MGTERGSSGTDLSELEGRIKTEVEHQLRELAQHFSPRAIAEYRRSLQDTDPWSLVYRSIRYWLDVALKTVINSAQVCEGTGHLSAKQVNGLLSSAVIVFREHAIEQFGLAYSQLVHDYDRSDRRRMEQVIQFQIDQRCAEWIASERVPVVDQSRMATGTKCPDVFSKQRTKPGLSAESERAIQEVELRLKGTRFSWTRN